MKKDYDVAEAFGAIEKELIDSMLRNYKRHKTWESEEGFDWTMWQAEQLKNLQQYKKRNNKYFKHRFMEINEEIEEMIKKSYMAGSMGAEIEILEAVKNGFRPRVSPKVTELITDGQFFKINDRKLNALVKATKSDMAKADVAMLRKADDEYRKTIFNTQVYANTGSGTYEQCVDMATKDFLSKGINCIEYKNGARVNIADYAAMAIQTANKRAKLQGEGAKRKEWGITTILTIRRGGGCPKCTPFQGKVFIDDVWSGGTSKDGPYPLLSSAIAAGFYHPNCKDSHTTYFEGISTPPKSITKEQQQKSIDIYNMEQRVKYAERMVRKYKNLESGSLDEENKKRYKNKRQQWSMVRTNFNTDYMSNRFIPKFGDESVLEMNSLSFKVKKVVNSNFDMWASTEATNKNKAIRLYEKKLNEIQKTLPENFKLPKVMIIDFESNGINENAIAGYNRYINTMFINSKYDTDKKILKYLNSSKGYFANTSPNAHVLHELGHKYHYDIVETIANNKNVEYNMAKEIFEEPINQYIINNSKVPNDIIAREISFYAFKEYKGINRVNEIMAEFFTIRDKENDFVSLINKNIREVIGK